jgi:hypothetical protein
MVDRIFEALDKLNDPDLVALSGVWMGGDADLRRQAWAKISAVPRDDDRAMALAHSRDRLAGWVNDLGITWAGAYERSIVVPQGADQGNLRRNAVPAILDAVAATLFADLLRAEEREELLEPFRHVTESDAAEESSSD